MKCIYSHEGGAYCDKHDHGAVTVGCCGEESCPDRKVKTNADRIRAMTDEELAFYIVNHPMWSDTDACVAWLKSPAED